MNSQRLKKNKLDLTQGVGKETHNTLVDQIHIQNLKEDVMRSNTAKKFHIVHLLNDNNQKRQTNINQMNEPTNIKNDDDLIKCLEN